MLSALLNGLRRVKVREKSARVEAKFKSEQRVIIRGIRSIGASDNVKLYGRISFREWNELREEYVYSIDLDSGDVITAWERELEPDLSIE